MGYEPVWNDESFLQRYFHYNPPTKVVKTEDFLFLVSDKGGLENTRDMTLDVSGIKADLLKYRNENINIEYGKVTSLGGNI
jgi:hypothetical protein